MLSKTEKALLRQASTNLAIDIKWQELSWSDAWSGKYAEKPSRDEVHTQYKLLEEMLVRIRKGEDGFVYSDLKEIVRMIFIEHII